MGPGQIPDAHQKLIHDLSTGKTEGAFEELDPSSLSGVMGGQPAGKGAVAFPELKNLLRVGNGSFDLQPVPDNAAVVEQPLAIGVAVRRDYLGSKAAEGLPEGFPFPENGDPGQPRLIDLQHQALEQGGIVLKREAVLPIVIGPVPLMARGRIAISLSHGDVCFGLYACSDLRGGRWPRGHYHR